MQAQDIITAALTELGELAPQETPNADDLTDGLSRLNALIASWDIIRLNIFAIQENLYALTSGTGAYTIGSGGAFAAARPVSIRAASFVTASGHRFPLEPITAEEWAAITERGASGKVPRKLYYDNNYPLATLNLWPVPSAGGQLDLLTWEQLAQLPLLTTTFDMPPGYERALKLNLALQLAPLYRKPVDPQLAQNAAEAKAALRGLNAPPFPGAAQEVQASGVAQPAPAGELLAEPR